MDPPSPPSAFHIPSLDGIRALSIAIVFAAHAGLSDIIPGGFGVTVFFFLSGFLITTLLRREYAKNGRISFRNFYIRRALRIFPPFYGALLFALVLETVGLLPDKSNRLGITLLAAHLGNYAQISWEGVGIPSGTGVYWSLAVEEHFYLIFPAIALLLLRKGRKAYSLGILAGAALLIVAWRIHLVHSGVAQGRIYMGTDTRFDSILFGCLLALVRNPSLDAPLKVPRFVEWVALGASGVVLVFSFLYRDPAFRESWRYSLQGLALMPVFYLAIRRASSPLFRWLEQPALKYVGLLSYTLYLVHYVILLSLVHLGLSPVTSGLLGAAVSVGVAALSYHFMELPLARIRKKYSLAS